MSAARRRMKGRNAAGVTIPRQGRIRPGDLLGRRVYTPADLEGAMVYGLCMPGPDQEALLDRAEAAMLAIDSVTPLGPDGRQLVFHRLTAALVVDAWRDDGRCPREAAFAAVLREINNEARNGAFLRLAA